MKDLVLVRSDMGDGGWSLHTPGSTDEEIVSGKAPYLLSGESDRDKSGYYWMRPNAADYSAALEKLRREK